MVLVLCNFRISLEPQSKILLQKIKVLLFSKLCVEYVFLVKMKRVREQRRCYHANIVAKSITGAAWEDGLNIEVHLNIYIYCQIASLFSICSEVLKSKIICFYVMLEQICFIGVHGLVPLAAFVRLVLMLLKHLSMVKINLLGM